MTYSIFHSTKALQVFLECFTVLAIALAWARPRLFNRHFRSTAAMVRLLSGAPWFPITIAGVLPLLVRLVLLPVFPIPEPKVHDEFSYLLLADTLAHHRVANPTPAYWQHFETEYELMKPAYASQYQPAQGMVLALGQSVFGNPWWGVWLSIGVMCAVICWALQFALPARWAAWGGLIAGLQFGIFGFWMNSYFGGAVSAIGGALVFPAVAAKKGNAWLWTIAASGVVILLASRPVEGMIWLGVLCCVALSRRIHRTWVVAAAGIVLLGVVSLTAYNKAVTGKALTSPYAAYRHEYGTPQSYWWQSPVVIANFDHEELRANYQDQLRYWQRRYSVSALWDSTWRRLRDFWRFFIGPFLTPAAIFALFALKRRKMRRWVFVSIPFLIDHATYHAWYPQQSASETVLIVFFLVEGWRCLRVWRRREQTGKTLSRNLGAGFALACTVLCVGLVVLPATPSSWNFPRRVLDTMTTSPSARAIAIRRLARIPGKHLVFVHYGVNHSWYDEWVFNGADISGSKIVFARMCSAASDRALIDSMRDRDVWIANPDSGPMLARVSRSQLLLASARGPAR